MTGIFQIFDRYKSKSYAKNDRRKSNPGESENKAIPNYYLVEEDGVPRKVVPDQSDRQSRSEASRDSRRPSNADVSEVVVKTLTSSRESQTGTALKPHSARPSTDSQKSNLSSHKSSSPRETQRETGGFKDSSKNPENYLSDAVTPKPTVPSRSSVDHRSRDGHKLPPRDTRSAPKSSAHRDRSRASVENVKEVSAHLDDARDISRAILQMREAAKSPYDGREARRHSPSVTRKDHVQRNHSSGDEREWEKYHRDGRRYQSSGDEKDAHRHHMSSDSREARRYSSVTSVTETRGEQAYDDEKDHHRPQFPSEGKDYLRSWHSTEGRRNQPASHVKDIPRYMSSGDELDRRSNMSSGDEKGAHRFHHQTERRDGNRHRGSHDQESNRSFWPVDRDGQKRHSVGDGFEGLRDESSGDERVAQRPPSSARRRHHQGSADERGHKYYSSRERGDGRRHAAYDAGRDSSQGLHSSGDERSAHRHLHTKDSHRRHSSAYYAGHRHQTSAAELNEHQRYQSAGEDQVGYSRHHASSAKASRHYQPSTSGYEGRRYQSSGDERGGTHRSFVPAGARAGGQRHEPPLHTYNSWQNESSDDDREVYLQQSRSNGREDARRSSNATDAHRRYSLGNDDGHRHSSSNDDRRRDRSRSSVRDASKYESAVDTREVTGEYQNIRSNDSHGELGGYEEAAVAPSLPIPAVPKDSHRRNSSVESRGEHRRRGSNSSVLSTKDSVKLHLSGDKARVSNSKDKESSSVYSRDLPPRSSRSHSSLQVSPRNMMDMRDLARLNVQVRESSQTPALRDGFRTESQKSLTVPDSSLLSPKSMTGSYDFREMLRQIDFKDSQWTSEKFGVGSSRNSVDGRDPPRTSNVSRASVDSRQYQTSTPRLSVDGREHLRASSLHSSRASSVDAQVQLRTNSMDSSTSGEFKRRGPSVVARLMGLAELPEKDTPLPASDRPQTREGKSLQKLLNTPPAEAASPPSDRAKSQLHLSEVAQQMKQVAARLHQDSQLRQKSVQVQQETRPKRKSKAKSRTQSRSRSPPPAPLPKDKDARGLSQHQGYGIFGRQIEPGSPLPRQPMSPKHHQMEGMPNVFKKRSAQDLSSGDLDQRLHQLRIKNSIQEHRTLKQILEAMHLKGLLHPPQKKPPKSPRAEVNEQGYVKEEAERPVHDFESKPSSSASNVARANRNDYQEQLNFEDLMRMDGDVHEEPALDIDHSGEASIVVMKPVNYHSATPPAATKEIDVNSESAAAVSGFEREKIEIGHRRRGSERRAGSSGKISRSHSLEPPEQRSSDKAQVEDLSFANVMLSWRERIAADAAKKATVEVAEAKPQSRSKSSASKHRSQDVSPLKYGGSTEKRAGSPRVQESLEEFLLNNRDEYDSGSRKILSDIAQENANHDEEKFKIVGRSKSDLQLSAYSAETLAAMEASLDRIPAQVAVLRSKRSSGKTSRSKEKLRASHPGDLRSKSSPLPSSSNLETCSLTDELVQDPRLQDLSPIKIMSPIKVMSPIKTTIPSKDSKAQGECTTPSLTPSLKDSDDSSRMTPKKRKIAEPVVVLEEVPQLPAVATTTTAEVQVPVSSNEEDDCAQVGEFPNLQCTPVADCEAEEPQDAKMEDAFDEDTVEAHTPEGFASGRDKCFSGDGAFTLQGADHPSPVSVLDSPIFQEGFHLEELSTSPDSAKSSMLRHEDAEDTLQREVAVVCEQEVEALTPKSRASKEASNPLRDIYTQVARSLELGEKDAYRSQPSADLQIPTSENAAALISGDHSKGRLYVQGILMESGLADGASTLPEDASEIMEFDVFTRKEEELQTAELERIDRGELEKTEEKRYKESLDRRLIFDCMNEILERKMSPFLNPQPWGAPVVRRKPCGQRLVDEVWDELKDMHWPTTVAYDALYAVLQKDFMRKGFQWLDFSVEVGDVGRELEHMILLELVEECVHDLTSIKPKPAKLQHLANPVPSPSPCDEASPVSAPPSPSAPSEAPSEVSQAPSEVSAVSSDDSERRRRELLDKTRRDLLAWHVQYQQM